MNPARAAAQGQLVACLGCCQDLYTAASAAIDLLRQQ